MCFDCRAIVTGGSRKRMVVAENVTEEAAVRLEAENGVRTIPEEIPETAVSRRQLPAVNVRNC